MMGHGQNRKSRTIKNFAAAGLCALTVMIACGKIQSNDSTAQSLASAGMSEAEIEAALKANIAVRLNLTTNRATLYRSGVALQQWNIATADVSGIYHSGQAKITPEGIYSIEDMEHCPVWRPEKPTNPATGTAAKTEEERWQIFNSQPEIYGPCGAQNPLGKYVFWFHGPYGMHGNSAEDILRLEDPEERRVSGGCVRNPNSKIKEIFHLALDTFPELATFKSDVLAMEGQTTQIKQTIANSARAIDMRVIVGRWVQDPLVSDSNSPQPMPTLPPTPTPTPIPEPVGPAKLCKAVAVDPVSGVAPIHITLPATAQNISAYYRLNDPIRVFGSIPGTDFYRTGRGYIESKYLGQCSNY